jgi:hypothetical protein
MSAGLARSRSISERTVSAADSGMPCAWAVIFAPGWRRHAGTSASTSASMGTGSSGPGVSVIWFGPFPCPGRISPGCGRAGVAVPHSGAERSDGVQDGVGVALAGGQAGVAQGGGLLAGCGRGDCRPAGEFGGGDRACLGDEVQDGCPGRPQQGG